MDPKTTRIWAIGISIALILAAAGWGTYKSEILSGPREDPVVESCGKVLLYNKEAKAAPLEGEDTFLECIRLRSGQESK